MGARDGYPVTVTRAAIDPIVRTCRRELSASAVAITYSHAAEARHRVLSSSGYPREVLDYLSVDFVRTYPLTSSALGRPTHRARFWEDFPGMPRTMFGRILIRNGYRDGTSIGLGEPRGALRGVLHLSFATDPHKQTVRRTVRVVGQLLESLVPWDALFWDGQRAGQLTARETEVLSAVMSGRSNREIAAHLGIATRTVATHMESIYRKLGTSSRTRAAVIGAYMGLIPTPGQPS